MASMLLAVIYLAFVSLGLPDSLLGSAWPTMRLDFGVPSSYAGYVSMTISAMTVLSALLCPRLMRRVPTRWIVVGSIFLTIAGLLGFSASPGYGMLFIFAVPYGLGAGSVDASLNHYVASHYSSSVMNFLHCFYGLGAIISPNIMAAALRSANWREGYRWTAYVQIAILAVCIASLPLWKKAEGGGGEEAGETAGMLETIGVPGVVETLAAFFCYSCGEATGFLWTSSYFAGTRPWMGKEMVASFGALVFAGLMIGRLISGFVSNRLGDRRLIRIGIAAEIAGIILAALPIRGYAVAAAGFLVTGAGMGPVYPAIQHMAPENFGRRCGAAAIGMQMAAAYVGSTFMPMFFGWLQERAGIAIMPAFLLVFAVLNAAFLEAAYKKIARARGAAG